ncbi:diguanylate cyclase domain-containing protein [Neptunomonas antarctica]|uniref:diguanylate cyclase domain-containing protein n=1 Tax=Neptunomonas antarctica TaxID=619304 RepID=UPI0009E7BEBA
MIGVLSLLAAPDDLISIINLSASIGINLFPSDSRTAKQLLNAADEAMYHAKNSPLHSFSFLTDIPKNN